MSARIPLPAGTRFGRLVVESTFIKNREVWANWRCECGETGASRSSSLRRGDSTSCGCRTREVTARRNQSHGLTFLENGKRRPEHWIWTSMIQRCTDPKNDRYQRYGGRGISVCERWLGTDGFANFFADMGERPSHKHQIDRINNDGNYEPGNCRWASLEQQARNKSTTRRLTMTGQTLSLIEWSHKTGIKPDTITERIKKGWSVERALTTPVAPWRGGKNSQHSTAEDFLAATDRGPGEAR